MNMSWDSNTVLCDSNIHNLSTTQTDPLPVIIYTYVYKQRVFRKLSKRNKGRLTILYLLASLLPTHLLCTRYPPHASHGHPHCSPVPSQLLTLVLPPLRRNKGFLLGILISDSHLFLKSYGSDSFSLVSPILRPSLTRSLGLRLPCRPLLLDT